jgi:hypothetical protein
MNDMHVSEDDIDLSWMEKHNRLANIQQNYFREPMTQIRLHFIYLNKHLHIDKVVSKNHNIEHLDDQTTIIYKEQILHAIQNNKCLNNVKYKLLEMILYNITIDPENIQHLSSMSKDYAADMGKQFLTTIPMVDDIKIPHSIFIFHEINSLYVVFQEVEDPVRVVKPILKIEGRSRPDSSAIPTVPTPSSSKGRTKKVSILHTNNRHKTKKIVCKTF